MVANEGGRFKWLSAAALQEALVPAVRAVCQVPDQHMELLPPDAKTRLTRPLRHHSHARPLPSRLLPSWGSQPSLGPRDTGLPPLELWPLQPDLRQVRRYTSPTDRPLHIVEICGGLATGLHAALRAGHAVASYSWADINPDTLVAARARLRRLHHRYPDQLPLSALKGWNTRLPFNANCLSPGVLRNFPEGIDWIIAGPPCQPYSSAGKHKGTRDPRSTALLNVAHLIRHLEEVQPARVGFIMENVPGVQRHPEILNMLGPGVELDAPPCGSGAKRATRFWQNLMDPEALHKAFDDLPAPTRSVNDLLRRHGITNWSTQAMVPGHNVARHDKYNTPGAPQIALPKLVCFPGSHAFRVKNGRPGPGMMFHEDDLKEPDATVADVLLGFEAGDTSAEGLSDQQRRHLLGQCIDMNLLTWLVKTISPIPAPPICPPTQSNPANPGRPTETSPAPTSTEYLSLQTLPPHAFLPDPDCLCPPPFPQPDSSQLHTPPAFTDGGGQESPATADRRAYATHSPPVPVSWCPAWNPYEWVYTDGSKQDPDPTLGAAVVHPASGLTILINATGQEELNTILRAELAAIHQALIVFRDIPTFKCLTDSLTSLQQLQTVLTRPQEVSYYPHHVLLHAIVEEIVARDTKGFVTHIRKVRAHVGVRGNDSWRMQLQRASSPTRTQGIKARYYPTRWEQSHNDQSFGSSTGLTPPPTLQ